MYFCLFIPSLYSLHICIRSSQRTKRDYHHHRLHGYTSHIQTFYTIKTLQLDINIHYFYFYYSYNIKILHISLFRKCPSLHSTHTPIIHPLRANISPCSLQICPKARAPTKKDTVFVRFPTNPDEEKCRY